MRDIWVISDTHFGHENIIRYCDRPFKDAMQMSLAMQDNWNSVVKPQDHVWHLGDVYTSWTAEQPITEFLRGLNGHKRLVLGNHDNGKNQVLQSVFQKIEVWRMFPEFGLLLTHVPVDPSALWRGKTGNEEKPKQLLNVHGHIHNKSSPTEHHRNVSVEQINYRPINIEELRIW